MVQFEMGIKAAARARAVATGCVGWVYEEGGRLSGRVLFYDLDPVALDEGDLVPEMSDVPDALGEGLGVPAGLRVWSHSLLIAASHSCGGSRGL
jgi:hypothetical protein